MVCLQVCSSLLCTYSPLNDPNACVFNIQYAHIYVYIILVCKATLEDGVYTRVCECV